MYYLLLVLLTQDTGRINQKYVIGNLYVYEIHKINRFSIQMPKSDFKMERFLGKGSYGSVSLVKRIQDGKQYALKEINVSHMQLRDRLDQLNEIRILASIYHPNVLGYFEAFIENGRLYIVTDYCGNGDLEKMIKAAQKSNTKIQEDKIWSIILQTLNGLRCIHQHNILHRDIKSQNILIANDVYKIADFGVSKVTHSGEMSKTAIGTPYYISPEIWRQERYNQKTDIYSLGCLFYELCTLKHPFNGRDIKELQRNVLKGSYKKIPDFYSQELRALIDSMMQPNPRSRPTVEKLIQMDAIQKRKEMCPTLFDAQVLAGTQTQVQYGLNSVVDEPTLLGTIKMDQNLTRAMNGRVAGQKRVQSVLPQAQYDRRPKWDMVAEIRRKALRPTSNFRVLSQLERSQRCVSNIARAID